MLLYACQTVLDSHACTHVHCVCVCTLKPTLCVWDLSHCDLNVGVKWRIGCIWLASFSLVVTLNCTSNEGASCFSSKTDSESLIKTSLSWSGNNMRTKKLQEYVNYVSPATKWSEGVLWSTTSDHNHFERLNLLVCSLNTTKEWKQTFWQH